jgi:hypothetical protein
MIYMVHPACSITTVATPKSRLHSNLDPVSSVKPLAGCTIYNALNQVVCPDFFINVLHFNFQPSTPIPISKVRRKIQRWIDGLDYEEVMAIPKRDSFDVLPSHFIEHEGNTVKLVAIPKKLEARGLPDVPTVGGRSGDAVWVHTHEDIKSAVKKKHSSRYDLGGIPYVVAVRCPDALTRPMDVERALFGLASGDRERDLDRHAISDLEDGIWAGVRGATNTSISGVLSVWDIYPWSVKSAAICLYENPWATRPLDAEELAVTDARLTPRGIEYNRRDSLLRF